MPLPQPPSRAETVAFCRVLAHLVAADHKITGEERTQLNNLIWDTGLSPEDAEVKAAVEAELAKPSPLEKVLAPIHDAEMKKALYRAMVEVAASDGLHSNEEEALAQTAKAFGLNAQAAKEIIQWTVQSIGLDKIEAEILKRL